MKCLVSRRPFSCDGRSGKKISYNCVPFYFCILNRLVCKLYNQMVKDVYYYDYQMSEQPSKAVA